VRLFRRLGQLAWACVWLPVAGLLWAADFFRSERVAVPSVSSASGPALPTSTRRDPRCVLGKHDFGAWGHAAWDRWGFGPPHSETRLCKRRECWASEKRYFNAAGDEVEWKVVRR
jgi:hypothetical protein